MDMSKTNPTKEQTMTTITEQCYDATAKQFVGFDVVLETTATELAHLASKMPYMSDDDAFAVWEYLQNRFNNGLRLATGIKSPTILIERAIAVRAAAENAATSQEVAA
jgi:hypothetical protein